MDSENCSAIRNHIISLSGELSDYTPLLEMISDAHCVVIGEATEHTHNFSQTRWEITQLLFKYFGFHALLVESNWQSAQQAEDTLKSLNALMQRTRNQDGKSARIIVWENNTNEDINASKTHDKLPLSQWIREQWGDDMRLIGISTHCIAPINDIPHFYVLLRNNPILHQQLQEKLKKSSEQFDAVIYVDGTTNLIL